MIILKRGDMVYYIKDEAIIAGFLDFQYVAYTVYALQNRKPFYDFKKAILNSKKDEYTSQIELMRLGLKFKLRSSSTQKPKEAYNENNIRR